MKRDESDIWIEGIKTKGLVDSGSIISTICQDFINQMVPRPQVHSLDEIELQVKRAVGRTLPYLGYVELKVESSLSEMEPLIVPLLVVPVTEYIKTVPLIVGTNIIRHYRQLFMEDRSSI